MENKIDTLLELLTGESLMETRLKSEIVGLDKVILSAKVSIDYLTNAGEIKTIAWEKTRPINFQ